MCLSRLKVMHSLVKIGRAIALKFPKFFRYLDRWVLAEVMRRAARHRLSGLSAEIAYNAIFALFPAILAVVSAIGLLELPASSFQPLLRELNRVIPDEAQGLIQGFVQTLRTSKNQSLFSLSFLASIWVSSNAMGSAMAALDQIHQVSVQRLRSFWKAKLVSIGLSFGTFWLLIAALVTLVVSDFMVRKVVYKSGNFAHGLLWFWHLLSLPMALVIGSRKPRLRLELFWQQCCGRGFQDCFGFILRSLAITTRRMVRSGL
jgi:membrane protein